MIAHPLEIMLINYITNMTVSNILFKTQPIGITVKIMQLTSKMIIFQKLLSFAWIVNNHHGANEIALLDTELLDIFVRYGGAAVLIQSTVTYPKNNC